MAPVLDIVASILAAAALAGIVYQAAAAALVWRFARAPAPQPASRPGMSVLKPLKGDEPGLADNLRALCALDYRPLQIVCNTIDPVDPAQRVAQAMRSEFPDADIAVVSGAGFAANNRKVASLENLLRHARHEIVVFADADARPGPDYLDDLAASLAAPGVGLATCLYVGRAEEEGFWSRLEALWINHGFLPSVLVARAVGRRDGCFGATVALSREVLDRAGGLEPLRDKLADDWALGAAVRKLGLGIALAARPVAMIVHQPSFAAMFAHELRWGRTIAALDRAGYAASIVTQPVALAALGALVSGCAGPYLAMLAAAIAARLVAIRFEERALGLDRAPLRLLALREFLTFAVFGASFWGRTVRWRGVRYRIRRDGSMEPLEDSAR